MVALKRKKKEETSVAVEKPVVAEAVNSGEQVVEEVSNCQDVEVENDADLNYSNAQADNEAEMAAENPAEVGGEEIVEEDDAANTANVAEDDEEKPEEGKAFNIHTFCKPSLLKQHQIMNQIAPFHLLKASTSLS